MPLQPLVYWLAIEDDVEDIRRYMTGVFHPIILGDSYELVFETRLFDTGSILRYDMFLGEMAALCAEVPSSWKSYWESKESFRTMRISHEAADSAWQLKLDHLANCKLTNAPTKADVSEFIALIGSMLKMNPGSRPSADEVLQHPWFACGKLITGKVPSDIVNIILS